MLQKKIFILLLLFSTQLFAYTPSKEAKISILTASSGKEIYKIYGHSAIRFQDNNRDLVFNYGMFSFDEPHFIFRYLQGKNYYLLGVESFRNFNHRYYKGGEKVTEQTLNLNTQEVTVLYNALKENAKPENRKYLYNVIYDNCATRVYKILEDHIQGGIIWDNECPTASFRDLLHECNNVMPFSQLGIDIVFGPKADLTASCREAMFLPEKMMIALSKAKKQDGAKLISSTNNLLNGRKVHNNKEKVVFHILFSFILLLAVFIRLKTPQLKRYYQIILYSIIGLFSLVVCFIAFFSIHPTVLPNPNLIWINPFWLFFAILISIKKNIKPFWQKILNGWSLIMVIYLFLGIIGIFYIHYGLIYILSTLVILSYKKQIKKT